jgi:homoserine O-acetyltransferase
LSSSAPTTANRTGHPPLQPGWIDAPHHRIGLGDFALESGAAIQDFSISFAVHGDLADRTLPVAIALCAIGSVHHRLDFLIGPDQALDPRRMRIIAIDAIGNGLTTSPSNSQRQPGMHFPKFTIRDMVRSQKLLLEKLGIEELALIIGASMGGMQALQWGVEYPDAARKIVALTPMAKTAPWAAAVNQAARQGLIGRLGDQAGGAAYPKDIWDTWIPIMQLLAMRTPAQVDREFPGVADVQAWIGKRTAWWQEQGFDPIDWIYQSWAYDGHDVGSGPGFGGNTMRALESISADTLIIAPTLDLYNPIGSAQAAASHIPRCEFHKVESDWGHLMASAADKPAALWMNAKIRQFLG